MSMIDRYKKSGGFLQLLQVLETCGPQKKEKFLKLIQEESPVWAEALEKKMLSMERIFKWDANTIAEIMVRMPEVTLAVALKGFSKEQVETIFKTFSASQKRRIEDLSSEKNPNPGEIAAAFMKIMEEIRAMVKNGYLRFDKFDPDLIVPDGIEEKLGGGGSPVANKDSDDFSSLMLETAQQAVAQAQTSGADREAVEKLSSKILVLSEENKRLHKELKVLKEKLEQIRKIA